MLGEGKPRHHTIVIASETKAERGNLHPSTASRDCFGWLRHPRNDRGGRHCEHPKGAWQSRPSPVPLEASHFGRVQDNPSHCGRVQDPPLLTTDYWLLFLGFRILGDGDSGRGVHDTSPY